MKNSKYRVLSYYKDEFIVEYKDIYGNWQTVQRYCGGPAQYTSIKFTSLKEAKEWIKEDKKNKDHTIVWEE